MFQKNKNKSELSSQRKTPPSVISSDINLLGNIISDGLIDFDGNIHGNIHCHTLIIRANAKINGEVKADFVQITGKVKGAIEARNVVLKQGSEVEGTIMHEQVTIEEGAIVDGKLKKVKKATALLEQHTDDSSSTTMESYSNKEVVIEDEENARIMEHIRLIAANE